MQGLKLWLCKLIALESNRCVTAPATLPPVILRHGFDQLGKQVKVQ